MTITQILVAVGMLLAFIACMSFIGAWKEINTTKHITSKINQDDFDRLIGKHVK